MNTAVARTLEGPRTSTAPRAPGRRRRTWIVRGSVALLAASAVAGLAWASRPKPVVVDVASVTRGDLLVYVDEVARTRVRDRYVVSAPLAGNLLRIELRPGDVVHAGGVLARIAPMDAPLLDPRTKVETAARSAAASAGERQARAAIARAEIALRHADDELARNRKLADGGSIALEAVTRAELEVRLRTEELASSRFAQQMAVHEAAMARAALARFDAHSADGFDVPAPVDGRVLRVLSQSAGPTQPGTPLLEVGDPAALEVVTEVLSADAVRIGVGARVSVERWGGPSLRAHVRRVEPSATTKLSALGVEEQRVSVIVDLDEPRERWSALGDNFRVETRIAIEEKKGVLRVPAGALFRRGGGWAAYVVGGGRARLVAVTPGVRNDAEVEISAGIAEGERVVVHPSERVADGVAVSGR